MWSLLSSLHGKPLDLLYAFLVHRVLSRYSFFSRGWGDLRCVQWLSDIVRGVDWPPPIPKIQWKLLENGERNGRRYRLLEGTFDSPSSLTVLTALPPESRKSRVRLLVPTDSFCQQIQFVLHLPGTGDQGFGRRTRLGMFLLKHNVASMMLESPYYGRRRPVGQYGCRLKHVSDLLTLGRATIEESLSLLYWAKGKGFGPLGICGLSMGGVHACMVAALYPDQLACSPLLAPRSAAVAFCEGALQHGITNWRPLTNPKDTNDQDIEATLHRSLFGESLDRLSDLSPNFPNIDGALLRSECLSSRTTDIHRLLSEQLSTMSCTYYPDDNTSDETSTLALLDAMERYKALKRLQQVLETFTDVRHFPIPHRPDAVVFVAAKDDAYALPHSAVELHRHWRGSELRWITGGHVSGVLFHIQDFCDAIVDSLRRLQP